MNLPYNTIQDLAIELRNRQFPNFQVLPYNRFDVKHSQHWWLSPTTENPAFRFGKIRLTTNDSWIGDGRVFCGFDVEKGVLHEGDWPKTNIMDDAWFWHRFLIVAGTAMANAVDKATEAVGEDLQLFMALGPLVGDAKRPQLLFDVDGSGRLTQVMYDPEGEMLGEIGASRNLTEWGVRLRSLDGPLTAWDWIDVLVGRAFDLNPEGADDTDACAAMLKPFEKWMRAA